MVDRIDFTLAEVHALVAARQYSYEQFMKDTLHCIHRQNLEINAIVALQDDEDLLAQAKRADETPISGALHGIPIALKDLVNVANIVTTFGSPLFKGNTPGQDDVIAARIRAAGAIIIGKTNTPEFGFGSQTYNRVYGETATPYDLNKTSGGSSGGAAAALASGMLIVADGSDMMGSLRNPAAFCNVYGFRPTYGVVPNEPDGDVFMHQLSTVGPMARTPNDLAQLLDVMAGPISAHPHSLPKPPAFTQAIADAPPSGMRIGWLGDWEGALPMEPGVTALCEQALSVFEQSGHQVEHLAAPLDLEKLWTSWTQLRGLSIAASLGDTYQDELIRAQLKPEAVFEIETGLALSASDIVHASALRAQWFAKTVQLFSQYDALVLPSSQVFPFDKTLPWPKLINDRTMDTYHRWMEVVVPASLVGLPAVNVPVGFSANQLPMGMQLIGAKHADATLLQLAQQYHIATQWPQKRPPALVS